MQRVQRAFEEIRARYPGRIDEDALATRAIQAMLQSLDQHSTLLDENAYRALQQDLRGNQSGFGAEVELGRDALTVKSSQENTPAYQAGLRSGDRITALDGVSVAGLSREDVLRLSRGEIGSNMRLTVLRSGEDAPRTVTVKRTPATRNAVHERRLENDVAYLRIERFHQSTPQLVLKALKRLEDSAAREVAGLVLDLRGNPGGAVREAVAVSAAFLPEQALVVSLDGPSVGTDARMFARLEDLTQGTSTAVVPAFARTASMVVLIDGGSASAAEIVAGALQDHGRAVLVGTRTYGKGSVQSVVPLGDGRALKVTAASYVTPGGRSIQGKGIEPDARIEARPGDKQRGDPADNARADTQLDEALRILEAALSTDRRRTAAAMSSSTVDAVASPVAKPASPSPIAR